MQRKFKGKVYITISDAMEMLGVSRTAITDKISTGELDAIEFPMGDVRFWVLKSQVIELSRPRPVVPRLSK